MADVCLYDLSGGLWGPSVEVEQVVEGLLVGGHVGGHAAGFGSAAGGGVDQHGFADPAEGVEECFDGRGRGRRGGLCRRRRWASCRASTQVKVWTAMLWSVQWCIGENDTSWGSLSCRKPNSISDWER